jgi:hypothetical protein
MNMRKAPIIVCLALLGLAGLASTSARPLKPEEEARITPVGKPVNCLRITEIDQSRVRNDQTIDFYMRGGRVFRSHLPYACSQLAFEERFAYNPQTQELCSSDIITVLVGPSPMQGPSCGLGPFQEVAGAPRGH